MGVVLDRPVPAAPTPSVARPLPAWTFTTRRKPGAWPIPPHHTVFAAVLDGHLQIRTRTTAFQARAGQALVLHADEARATRSKKSTGARVVAVAVTSSWVDDHLPGGSLAADSAVLTRATAHGAVLAAADAVTRGSLHDLEHTLLDLMDAAARAPAPKRRPVPMIQERIEAHLRTHLRALPDPHDLEMLTGALWDVLEDGCRRARGVSILDLHHALRVEHARVRLLSGATAEQAAEAVGLREPLDLDALLRRHFGVGVAAIIRTCRR